MVENFATLVNNYEFPAISLEGDLDDVAGSDRSLEVGALLG